MKVPGGKENVGLHVEEGDTAQLESIHASVYLSFVSYSDSVLSVSQPFASQSFNLSCQSVSPSVLSVS